MTQPTARTTVASTPAARDGRRLRARRTGAAVALAAGTLLAAGAALAAATLSTSAPATHSASGSSGDWFYLD
jgi:hypothetical protein